MFSHRFTAAQLGVVACAAIASGCQDSTAPAASITSISLPAAKATAQLRVVRNPIANQYIVVLRDANDDVGGRSKKLIAKTSGRLKHTFKGLHGFAANMSPEEAASMAQDPSVKFVEQDQVVFADGGQGGGKKPPQTGTNTQTNARWNLDRIDQSKLPLSGSYSYSNTGAGVNVYIVDTGIRTTHVEFGGRATADFSAINDGYGAEGCHWHGSHVAGTVGGETVGVAKSVKLHSVRVLDCNAQGSWSDVIAGVDWVTSNAVLPAVMNISVSGGYSQALNDALDRAIAAGITVVVAAGNNSADACSYSPASVSNALTVAASGSADNFAAVSNFGSCVDIIAPGENVVSAWNSSDTWLDVATGTSMASPHVAGAAAMYLETNPQAPPAEVTSAIRQAAIAPRLKQLPSGTTSLLLHVQ